ncbi:hypothetical protein, unknown function [Leishmania braziliensis MHOM/BR/75/M2904]|uniref:EF-hand domain-containing protein n=2 Tax=Leishmania braziliensis TaxID=5660 RepID=A4HC86_LEIBR|nr:hypothetical protein, unknown function [Leishmania braziliensis MHOM/BR/75/M2904]KAI5686096.1 hypothetical protein MNV84_03764 [Leishmania braziliensis]CAJ2472754.1 unnamed protein product [Leishmania braziliensis]CAJ2473283.1 unnamed protein product [Leishmania braziliensis]CAM45079.1 hypothetical protein, unknown function [Leishmania braziliensis MHOM/BR/75/M2904]SYZ65855.1 hypothetical_protein [Leishmania braziliensis MHOM/BR/75/M2904]
MQFNHYRDGETRSILMKDSQSFLCALLAAKKQQANELFGSWDVKGKGYIATAQLRPLLLSLFPAPSSVSEQDSGTTATHLSVSQVKTAYESVTGRPWPPHASLSTGSASAKQSHRHQDSMYAGPTLSEVHAIIDVLCGGERQPKVALTHCSRDGVGNASTRPFAGRKGPTPNTAPLTLTSSATESSTSAAPSLHHRSLTSDAGAAFLYGSIEAIYRSFCRAAASPGELEPDTLPIDAVHLERIAWNVQAQRLSVGEGHALHRLLAAKATTVDPTTAPTTSTGADAHLTLEAFVKLLCAM